MDTTYIRSRTILLGTKREGQAKIEKNKERKNLQKVSHDYASRLDYEIN